MISDDCFNVFCLDRGNLAEVIKDEVGVIQGHRRSSSHLRAISQWKDDDEDGAAAGDYSSSVVKLKSRVRNPSRTPSTQSNHPTPIHDEVRGLSQRMLGAFCWRLNIPFPACCGESRAAAGGAQTRKGEGKGSSSKKDGGTSNKRRGSADSENSSNNAFPSQFSFPSGGGRRPPDESGESTSTDPDVTFPTEEGTTTSSSVDAGFARQRKDKNKSKRAKAKVGTGSSNPRSTSRQLKISENGTPEEDEALGRANTSGKPSKVLFESSSLEVMKSKLDTASTSAGLMASPLARKPAEKRGKTEKKTAARVKVERKSGSLVASVEDVRRLTEKDDEWLFWTSSEDEYLDEDMSEGSAKVTPNKDLPVARHLQQFASSVRVLEKVKFALGLDPYQRTVRSNECIKVTWNVRTLEFFIACVNALIFLLVTLNTLATLVLITGFRSHKFVSTSKEFLLLDFANHVSDCLFLTFITLFLSIWAVSGVLELGAHYAQFMTRFNLGICALKYDVTEGIHSLIKTTFTFTALFLSTFVILFFGGRTKTAIVREACGFVGLAVLRPFNYQLRESIYFPLVEIFGLLVFLHSFLCLICVLLQIAVYAKALENMARRFNLRLVYRLGMISEGKGNGSSARVKKYIPYSKLEAEHQVIVSLFHHLGQVNGLVFNAFLLSIALELMLVMWMLLESFVPAEGTASKLKYIKKAGETELAVSLRLTETMVEALLRVAVILLLTLGGFFLFGGAMHNAADALQIGKEYVRRQGLILSKTKKDIRFVLTMMNSYTSKYPFWIGKIYSFSRHFMIAFVGFIIAASMVFASFHPLRTGVVRFLDCDDNGDCRGFIVQRSALQILYSLQNVQPNSLPSAAHARRKPSTTTYRPHKLLRRLPPYFYLDHVCSNISDYPFDIHMYASQCPSRWPQEEEDSSSSSFPQFTYIPHQFKTVSKNATHHYFATVVNTFANVPAQSENCSGLSSLSTAVQSIPNLHTSACVSAEFTCNYFPYPSAISFIEAPHIVNCFGDKVSSEERDDCGNFKLPTPSSTGVKIAPKVILIDTRSIPGLETTDHSLLCCYEYGGFMEGEKQARVCNMPGPDAFDEVCQFGTSRPRIVGVVEEIHERILARNAFEMEERKNSTYLQDNGDVLNACICKLDNKPPDDKEVEMCRLRFVPPCIYSNEMIKEEYYALECQSTSAQIRVYIPLLFKLSPGISVTVPVEHKRFKSHCKGARFRDSFDHEDSLSYPNTYEASGENLELTDCAAKKLSVGSGDKDDCLNWRVSTPDLTGMMLEPAFRLVQFHAKEGKIVKETSGGTTFLCCFHYASDVFQRNADQLKYCNAPSLDAMNSKEFCGTAVQRGLTREPLPPLTFPPRLHQQLNEKLKLIIAFHKKKNGQGLLEDAESQAKWSKCLCPNLIPSFQQSDYESAVEECKAMLPTPCELDEFKAFDAYSKCKHKWNSLPGPPNFVIPRLFMTLNGMWEAAPRFQNNGQLGDCLKDQNWRNRFKSGDDVLDCFGQQFPAGIDECTNLEIPFGTGSPQNRILPQIHISAAYLLGKYDPSFNDSKSTRCCYSYANVETEQWRVCNMPDSATFKAKCASQTSSSRKKHESELVRRRRVELDGAEFLGDKVVLSPSTLKWNTPQEKAWLECICKGYPPGNAAHSKCERNYLPPCIKPKNTPTNYIAPTSTFKSCSATWQSGSPAYLSVPIVMQFNNADKSYKVVKRFSGKDCPSEHSKDALLSTDKPTQPLTDCFGQSIPSPVTTDECGNPFISTPDSSGQRKFPEMRLVPLDRTQEFTNIKKVFCCYQYPFSSLAEVGVCNKPSKAALEKQCSSSRRSARQVYFAAFLMNNDWARAIFTKSYSDSTRVRWTKCICEGNCPDSLIQQPTTPTKKTTTKKPTTTCKPLSLGCFYGVPVG